MGELSDIYRAQGAQGVKDYFNKVKPSLSIPKKPLVDKKHDTDSGMTPKQRRTIEEVEAQDRGYKTEKGTFVNADGVVLLTKRGGRSSVGFDWNEFSKVEGSVLTHNHPNETAKSKLAGNLGLPFSAEDIGTAATANLSEVRAQSDGYVYSLRRPKDGYGTAKQHRVSELMIEGVARANRIPEQQFREMLGRNAWGKQVMIDYEAVYRDTLRRYTSPFRDDKHPLRICRGRDIFYVKNQTDLDRINTLTAHKATQAIAKKYGFEYTRRKQKGVAKKHSF